MNLKRPKPSEPFLDARGLVTRPWFNYLSALTPDEASAEIGAQITALAQRVSTLEGEGGGLPRSTRAYGQFSVQSNGTLSDGVVVFNLVNDEAAPAPRSYYGTDADGARGYHPLPSGGASVPYFIPEGQTFNVAEFQQALFAMTIDVEGVLDVDGYLIEVN